MAKPFQFSLRTIFWLIAVVAVAVWLYPNDPQFTVMYFRGMNMMAVAIVCLVWFLRTPRRR
jgi:hypothetical protein